MLRRGFLSRFPAYTGLLALGQAQPIEPNVSGPARHAKDEWLDRAPRGHRAVFDAWSADKFGGAVGYASNWIRYNKEEYSLTDADLAVVIVARHGATPFAFNEKTWEKYGKIFAANMSRSDPSARANTDQNTYANSLDRLTKQGVRLAICNVTTRAYVDIIARDTGADRDAVRAELTAGAIGAAQFVPAGVIAVTRAQEYGYGLVSVG